MESLPDTTNLNNWIEIVVVINKKAWIDDVKTIFHLLLENTNWIIPHYTLRQDRDNDLVILFRVLICENRLRTVEIIKEVMNGYTPYFTPTKDILSIYFIWQYDPSVMPIWTKEMAKTLHEISKSAVDLISNNESNMLQWAHLFSNMIGVQDKKKIEKCLCNQISFF